MEWYRLLKLREVKQEELSSRPAWATKQSRILKLQNKIKQKTSKKSMILLAYYNARLSGFTL